MATIFVGILFVAYVIWHYGTYNSLVNAKLGVEHSWSNVEVELKRRLDLIANLIEVVKGYSKHEVDTLVEIVKARNGKDLTSSAQNANDAAPLIKQTLSDIFVLAESYPDLKANQSFLDLQTELANTENRIAERRNAYNQTVSVINNLCHNIPSNILASLHKFEEQKFFDISDAEAKSMPAVSFS